VTVTRQQTRGGIVVDFHSFTEFQTQNRILGDRDFGEFPLRNRQSYLRVEVGREILCRRQTRILRKLAEFERGLVAEACLKFVHCNTLKDGMSYAKCRLVTHCNTLQRTATHCKTPHHIAPHRTTSHNTAPHRTTPHHTAPHRNIPQHAAVSPSNTLQHTATHFNTPQENPVSLSRHARLSKPLLRRCKRTHIGNSPLRLTREHFHTTHFCLQYVNHQFVQFRERLESSRVQSVLFLWGTIQGLGFGV